MGCHDNHDREGLRGGLDRTGWGFGFEIRIQIHSIMMRTELPLVVM